MGRPCFVAACAAVLSTALLGCASPYSSVPSQVAQALRQQLGPIQVLALEAPTDGVFDSSSGVGTQAAFAQGAHNGARSGAAAGVELALGSAALAPALAPILVPVMSAAASMVGGAMGALLAVPPAAATDAHTLLQAQRDITPRIAAQVQAMLATLGRSHATTTAAPGARLELAVPRWGLAGGSGADPVMLALVELAWKLRIDEGATPTAAGTIRVEGIRLPLREWTDPQAGRLHSTFDALIAQAAEAVVEMVLLRQHGAATARSGYCGLEPLEPLNNTLPGMVPLRPPIGADSAPLLRWSAWPASPDAPAPRYDLRVWQGIRDSPQWVDGMVQDALRYWAGEDYRPGMLVYERKGLLALAPNAAPPGTTGQGAQAVQHRIESTLLPDTVYLWSVRPRLGQGDQQRLGAWAHYRPYRNAPGRCAEDVPPPGALYRWRTPPAAP